MIFWNRLIFVFIDKKLTNIWFVGGAFGENIKFKKSVDNMNFRNIFEIKLKLKEMSNILKNVSSF